MPAALTVDQSLVDKYLARVDRFWNNVDQFGQQLKEMANEFKDRFMPSVQETPMYQDTAQTIYQETAAVNPVYQEPAAAQPEKKVVTADEIDLDSLLAGIDLGGAGVSM